MLFGNYFVNDIIWLRSWANTFSTRRSMKPIASASTSSAAMPSSKRPWTKVTKFSQLERKARCHAMSVTHVWHTCDTRVTLVDCCDVCYILLTVRISQNQSELKWGFCFAQIHGLMVSHGTCIIELVHGTWNSFLWPESSWTVRLLFNIFWYPCLSFGHLWAVSRQAKVCISFTMANWPTPISWTTWVLMPPKRTGWIPLRPVASSPTVSSLRRAKLGKLQIERGFIDPLKYGNCMNRLWIDYE